MLRVRTEQMEELDGEPKRRFHERLLEALRRDCPELHEELADTEATLAWIAGRHARAAVHRIETERDVHRFVVLSLLAATIGSSCGISPSP